MSSAYRNIARVVRPHGKRGEVIVRAVRGLPFVLEPGMEVALTPPALERDRFCTVCSVTDTGQDWLVAFSGIEGIDGAESIKGCYVLAHAEDVVLDGFEAAWEDLVGRYVVDARFGELGCITGVIETPANDVLEIEGPFGEVLVPIIEEAMDEIPPTGPLSTHIMDGLIDSNKIQQVMGERAVSKARQGNDRTGEVDQA